MIKFKFSVITICYNSADTIERTLKSVLLQTYTNYEYIIVDGGSTDKTLDIVKKYIPFFQGKMKYTSEPDKGIYDAMNKGIKHSCGDIICIVNSDDWLDPDALLNVENCYLQNNGRMDSVCCGWMNFHYESGIVQVLKTNEEILKTMAKKYEMGGVRHPAIFVPKLIYDKYGTFDISIRIMADTDIIVRFVEKKVNFIFADKILTNMSDGGTSNKNLMKACKDYSTILKKRNVRGLRYLSLYYKWCFKRYLKSLIPVSLLKMIRDVRRV